MSLEEFNRVWLPLAERFYRVAFYILESKEDAEDAVQDLFARLWKTRSTLETVANPLAFGITTVRNICLDRIKSAAAKRTGPMPEKVDSTLGSSEEADLSLIRKENLQKIRSCMARLPDIQRKVLEMRVFENMPYSVIARQTGLSEINVRAKISKARKNLRIMTNDEDN